MRLPAKFLAPVILAIAALWSVPGLAQRIQPAPAAAAPAPAPAPASTAPREIDRVIAVVNNDVITANELASRRRSVERQLRSQGIEMPPADVLEKQVLERLILDRALVQLAREQGLRVDEAQLDAAFGSIAEQNRMTPAELRAQIERDGVGIARFREELRNEMLITRLREREVDARVQISEADIDEFLAEKREAGNAPPEYNIAQILLRIPEGASPEQIERQRVRGEEILRQLERGADFARLAAAFSDAPDAMSGGVIGLRAADRLPRLFVNAVAGLQPGQTAPLQRSPNGFHVLKLLERQDSGLGKLATEPIEQTHARHILMRPSDLVPEPEVVRRLSLIRQRVLTGEADFAEMARQYSIDGSAGRGGDLGWVYPGDTVPPFEQAMRALKPGEISEPVRTPFGYHLIQVLERRTDTASPERVRAAARQAIRERRTQEALEDWLRQVRDRAYVEYREG
jgi:peptidyl-prolyl cis-trans isomerase SurA